MYGHWMTNRAPYMGKQNTTWLNKEPSAPSSLPVIRQDHNNNAHCTNKQTNKATPWTTVSLNFHCVSLSTSPCIIFPIFSKQSSHDTRTSLSTGWSCKVLLNQSFHRSGLTRSYWTSPSTGLILQWEIRSIISDNLAKLDFPRCIIASRVISSRLL